MHFMQSGKLDFVQSLMDFDPKLLVKDKLGNTPLHYAAEKYPEVLNSMLKKAQELGTVQLLVKHITSYCRLKTCDNLGLRLAT